MSHEYFVLTLLSQTDLTSDEELSTTIDLSDAQVDISTTLKSDQIKDPMKKP